VKTVADTFEVSRSNLIERLNAVRARAASYGKQDDEWLLPVIRELVDAHPTYGYRRITALLNRRFVRTASLWSITSASTASWRRRICCFRSILASGSIGHTTALFERYDRIQDGALTALRFMHGTARSCVSLSHSIRAIEKSWPGLRAPQA